VAHSPPNKPFIQAADPSELAPGTLIDGRYRVVRVIGVGGTGIVYEVEHDRTGQRLALKTLLDPAAGPAARAGGAGPREAPLGSRREGGGARPLRRRAVHGDDAARRAKPARRARVEGAPAAVVRLEPRRPGRRRARRGPPRRPRSSGPEARQHAPGRSGRRRHRGHGARRQAAPRPHVRHGLRLRGREDVGRGAEQPAHAHRLDRRDAVLHEPRAAPRGGHRRRPERRLRAVRRALRVPGGAAAVRGRHAR
jgi:hypothetical protein